MRPGEIKVNLDDIPSASRAQDTVATFLPRPDFPDIAESYARSGWRVLPLKPGSKEPACKGGCLAATIDPIKIRERWKVFPYSNIGIATGSGLLVVDVDVKQEGWEDSLRQLALTDTFTVKTQSGGAHYYYTMRLGERITVGTKLLPGIDWRGEGGYVVAPGSVINGKRYEIVRNVPVANAPDHLLARIREKTAKPRVVEYSKAHGGMVIANGRRNDTLFKMGCMLRRYGVDLNAILGSLRAINADHCEPPLEESELRQIAASVARYAPEGA